jgi:hypothetical protein
MTRMQRMGSWLAVRRGGRSQPTRFGPPLTTAGKFACALLLVVNHICIRVIRVIRGQNLFLLFLAEFWKRGPERNGYFRTWECRVSRSSSIRIFSLAGRTRTGL